MGGMGGQPNYYELLRLCMGGLKVLKSCIVILQNVQKNLQSFQCMTLIVQDYYLSAHLLVFNTKNCSNLLVYCMLVFENLVVVEVGGVNQLLRTITWGVWGVS